MAQPNIEPKAVTKPIQLLAAWLVGLVLVDAAFLTAASQIQQPTWASGALVVASILNVPIFLGFLFFMQTKFRPEMQEDTFYAKYLERKSTDTKKTEYIRVDEEGESKFSISEIKVDRRISIAKNEPVVQVNDLLPKFDEIVESLRKSGIAIRATFGSTSSDPKAPEKLIISMREGADPLLFQEVVRAVEPFGIEGVSISEQFFTDNDNIYVGSYVYQEYDEQITPFKGEVRRRIMQERLSDQELKKIVRTITTT